MYGTAAGFQEYHDARNREISGSWSVCDIEAALLAASEWIDGVYGPSFIGYKTGGFEQEREWPRTSAVVYGSTPSYVFDTAAIPDRVVNATYEAAYRYATTPGSLQTDYTPGKYKSVTIEGAISVEYAQFNNAYEVQTQIAAVDTLLSPLLDACKSASFSGLGGGSSRV